MPSQVIVPHSLRIAEVLTVALGLGLSTIAICSRMYTRLRIAGGFLSEDCKPAKDDETTMVLS